MYKKLLALALIPLFINAEHFDPENSSNGKVNETFTHSSLEENLLPTESNVIKNGSTELSSSTNSIQSDPLLAAVNEEVKRLELEFPDDYFDHLEDDSEEVRKLIRSRQEAIEESLSNSQDNEEDSALTQDNRSSRSYFDGTESPPTEYPILVPETEKDNIDYSTSSAIALETSTSAPTEIPSSTRKPNVVGSAISGIHQGANSLLGTITRPFTSGGLFGRRNTPATTESTTTPTTTTTTTTPSPTPEPTTTTETIPLEQLNCTGHQTEYQGKCYNVLYQLPCPDGQWLVEDPATGKGRCVINKCPIQNTAWYGGQCIKVGHAEGLGLCHTGMTTIIYKSGIVECECKPGYLYYDRNGNCYQAYTQGPCQNAQYFIIPKKTGGNKPVCMPNPCGEDGSFCNAPKCPRKRNCATLGSDCGTNGKFIIDTDTITPYCSDGSLLPEKIIGNVPTLSCAPGSKRDILGNCRTPTDINFS